jgi:hypothetical protein
VRAIDVLLHHSEPVDPTLLEWIQREIDHLLGSGAVPTMSVIGILIVVVPIVLTYLAWRRLGRYNDRR